ncbi:aldehyde dehydrogenase family protein [Nonomuraea sp. NPDC049158]|uniref:aldehyde dehydrogenase family protein n=1 Tax=Nonomuraea sp. NPDC049158 TaxID=3155649 RepID=UPI0033C0C380
MIARRRAIEEAINTDFGHRSRHETAIIEIVGVVQGIAYLQRNLRRFMRPTRRHIDLLLRFGSNHIEYQPLGVVGVISPWNCPINLSLMPVVTATAAGSRVMLKPSKLTPATNAVLVSMLAELFPPEQVTMVNGDGSAFSSLPFDHLVFTRRQVPDHRGQGARNRSGRRRHRLSYPRAEYLFKTASAEFDPHGDGWTPASVAPLGADLPGCRRPHRPRAAGRVPPPAPGRPRPLRTPGRGDLRAHHRAALPTSAAPGGIPVVRPVGTRARRRPLRRCGS